MFVPTRWVVVIGVMSAQRVLILQGFTANHNAFLFACRSVQVLLFTIMKKKRFLYVKKRKQAYVKIRNAGNAYKIKP